MADNLTTQSVAPATPPAATKIGTREVTYSGESVHVAPVGLVAFSGADDAKVATDINPATSDLQTAEAVLIGAVNETAPATDTANSGLNGRLQRIAQRLTSLIAFFVNGAGTAAAALRVTLASDDPAVSVLGATTGAAVITDSNGTIQQYLRGLIKLLITTSNYPERAFYGTTQTCINTAVDIAAGNFGATTTTYDNTNDAAVPYARWAKAVASFPDWAAAPAAGTTVDLYGLLIDVDGTSDDTQAPSGTAQGGARFFGSFLLSADDALQRRTITLDMLGVEKVDFYFKNTSAQNMNNDAGTNAILKVTPLAYGQVV